MANIGGITFGVVQTCTTSKNAIGESVKEWVSVFNQRGWLDMQSGDSKYSTHSAKIEESTHIFLCDYNPVIYALTMPDRKTRAVPDVRMIIKGMVYDVLLIDNPMERDEQLEIYLRKVGAWDGC